MSAQPFALTAREMAAAFGGALRQGDWKYVKRGGKKADEELYNLVADPSEKTDLAASEPARLKEMASRFKTLMEESQRGAK